MKPFFISIPHSGERVPKEAEWLLNLPEPLLMADVDRYVDRLYQPILNELAIPSVISEWHRYVVDLNRWVDEIDCDSVEGSLNPSGTHPKGFHWSVTTKGEKIMKKPMGHALHERFVKLYFEPFHQSVKDQFAFFHKLGAKEVYHIDAHSMPSIGTKLHRDPGERRKDIVVSDQIGKSASSNFKDLVVESFKEAGFEVAYNWPYIGGRITQEYGNPSLGHHTIQVELNRALYMDETSKALKSDLAAEVSQKIGNAIRRVFSHLLAL